MTIVCERCGRENPGDASFCAGCGAPLAAWPEAPREERKVVTVLFADLVGFTSRGGSETSRSRRAQGERGLERALALWRSLGATAYVLEGEALLAASA